MALNTTLFKENIYNICLEMNSISENGNEYFCNHFADVFQIYLNNANIITTLDEGTADGGTYTGITEPNTITGDNIGIQLKKIPDPKDPEKTIYKLANDLTNHFLIENGTDVLYATYIAADITTALAEATINCKTIGIVETTEDIHEQSCEGSGLFTGNPLTISKALTSVFESMLLNAQEQTEGYNGNREFSNTLGDIIHTFLIAPDCLTLTYSRLTPPFACTSSALIS